MPFVILISVCCGLLSAQIATRKNLNFKLHVMLGVLLGPIGVLITVLTKSKANDRV